MFSWEYFEIVPITLKNNQKDQYVMEFHFKSLTRHQRTAYYQNKISCTDTFLI